MELLELIGILCSAVILLVKVCVTSNLYEKLLIANSFSSNIILAISLFAFYNNSISMIDVALVYACISFLSTISFSYYFENS